jgi:sulfur carrier protein
VITVNGSTLEYSAGMTVQDILRARNFIFPLLVIKVNGQLILRGTYADTAVPDGANVEVIHLMSGG